MFIKLAFNNIKKSYKDYLIYFLTIAFGIALFYLFNSMSAQQKLMEADYISIMAMDLLNSAMAYVSVAMTAVLAFLMFYANQFLIRRRKKELGIYITLGMSRYKLSYILVLETLIIGIVSLIVGLVIGIFASHLLAMVTAKIFEVQMKQFRFVVSLSGILKSTVYFGFIFLLVMILNIYNVNKIKLLNLIYGDKIQKDVIILHPVKVVVLMILSISALVFAYYSILKNQFSTLDTDFKLSIVFGIIGTVLFFYSFSHLVMYAFKGQKKIYYSKLNAFNFKQISSKIRQTYILISILCIILLIAIGTICAGLSLVNVVDQVSVDALPYELALKYNLYSDQTPLLERAPEIKNHIKSYETVYIYRGPDDLNLEYKALNKQIPSRMNYHEYISYMTLTDFNKSKALQNEEAITLTKNQYYLVSNIESLNEIYKEEMNDINIYGENYSSAGFQVFQYENADIQENYGLVILNDEVMNDFIKTQEIIVVTDEINNASELTSILSRMKYETYFQVQGREDIMIQVLGTKTIVAYVSLYIGFVFIMTAVVCLSLQQLSDVSDHLKRYELLIKLGVEEREIKRSLFVQLAVYFLMPLSLAAVHSFIGIKALIPLLSFLGQIDIWKFAGITGVFLLTIYCIYFIATYTITSAIIFKRK